MKLPNGYGSVVKLSGNRRKPFAVRKTQGYNEKGHPIYKMIGYTETREQGLIMLSEYNKDPWNIDQKNITLKELFELYKEKRFDKLGHKTVGALNTSFKKCSNYYNKNYRDIKAYHMQDCIDKSKLKHSSKCAIKNFFWHLDKFALELDIINKSYSQLITVKREEEPKQKLPFTDKEVNILWDNLDIPFVDTVIILIYSGFRVNELLQMKIKNIDLKIGTFKGGLKTESGKNRIVPIHSKIKPLVINRFDKNNKFLFENLTYQQYYKIWLNIMDELKMNHTPHECRHTFRSKLDSAGANKVSIDLMLGHKSKDVGERIYTHKTVDELKKNIELLTF